MHARAARRECLFALEELQRQYCAQPIQPEIDDDGTELGALKKATAERAAMKSGLPKHRRKYFDPSFFIGSRDTLYPEGTNAACTIEEPEAVVRSDAVWPGVPLFDPELDYCEDQTFICPGGVASSHLITAVSALTQFTVSPG